jgi:hypothetical protein
MKIPEIVTSVLNTIRLNVVLLLIAIFSIGYFSYSCGKSNKQSKYEQQITLWKARTDSLLRLNTRVNVRVDSLNRIVTSDNSKANVISTEINKLRNVADRDRSKRDESLIHLRATLPDTCKVVIQLADAYQREADTLRTALNLAETRDSLRKHEIDLLHTNVTLLRTQNDSLVRLVVSVPISKPSRLLGIINLPTRKTSFVMGIVTGVVVATAVLSSH